MPWQSSGGGSDKPNPWGSGSGQGGGAGGGGEPPHIDELIRKSQERMKDVLPGGGKSYFLIFLFLIALWLVSGVYRVETNEQAVILRFGKYVQTAGSGLHWHLPYPVEKVEIRGVTSENSVEIGTAGATRRTRGSFPAGDEGLMLTGDENIVNIEFNVTWLIGSLRDYLFNLEDPTQTVKVVSESAMRELVGKANIARIITEDRGRLQQEARDLIQSVLDSYGSGVTVLRVQISTADAPNEVKDSFLDVQQAAADRDRFVNEAQAYANDVIPKARGNAKRIMQEAEAYHAGTVNRAEGEAARFNSILQQYRLAKDVTQKRIYLETMEEIMSGMDKIILESGAGAVPYLPLDQLTGGRKGTDQRRSNGGQNNE